jgi:hypothetical protein
VITGIDPGLVGDPAGELAEALKGLPAVLTISTAFALTVVAATAKRQRTASA